MRRAMRWIVAFLAAAATPRPVLGQTPGTNVRLGAELRAALQPAFDEARRDSVPLGVLEAKALEGQAKQRPAAQIVTVVRQLAGELRDARRLLREAAPAAPLSAGEILGAAEAMRRGVPAGEIRALRQESEAARGLEIAFAVLGALVERGIPAAEARAVIAAMLEAGVSQARMVEIPARVDVALRVGAPPGAALNSVLQGLGMPVPPVPVVPPGLLEAPKRRGPGGE
jgi:hypothetical protein